MSKNINLNTEDKNSTEMYDSDDSQQSNISCDYEEIVEEDIHVFDLDTNYDSSNIKRGKERISLNRMSKFEMVRIVGERIKQLTLGAKCFIKNKDDFDYETLAREELRLGLVPFKIIRFLPNNIKEEWSIEELEKEHLFI